MSGNMKEKVAVCVNDGKTTPAATVPMANAYANATVLEQIKNLAAAFRHRKSTKTSSQFLYLNRKGNDKIYQTPKIRLVTKLEKSQRARFLRKMFLSRTSRKNKTYSPRNLGETLYYSQNRRTANRFTDSHCHTSYKQLWRNKRENERRSELNLTRTTCHRVRSVFPVRLSKSPLCSPLCLDQSGFRFVSIGVSIEILRREQSHCPGHLAVDENNHHQGHLTHGHLACGNLTLLSFESRSRWFSFRLNRSFR
ncbi:hypothetical protein Bca4012_064456 [Brassica carinata]